MCATIGPLNHRVIPKNRIRRAHEAVARQKFADFSRHAILYTMNRIVFLVVFAALFQVSALPAVVAEEAAGEPFIWVSRHECDALVAYRPDPSVEYQPGVDATGRPVAPADLPGHQPLELSAEDVSVELRIPLSEFYQAPASLLPLIGNAEIDPGRVTVRDGVAYLGDQRLTDQEQNAIARACAERL